MKYCGSLFNHAPRCRTMKMILALTAFAILPHVCVSLAAGTQGAQLKRGGYEIRCDGGVVTVRANDANVVQLLTEFSLKSGITFNKYVGKTHTATLDLSGVTVEEFLNRVIGSYVATSKKKNGGTHISSVTIMDEGGENPPPRDEPPPPNEPEASDAGPKVMPQGPPREEREVPWRRDRSKKPSRRRMPHDTQPPDSPPPQPPEESSPAPPPADGAQPPEP